MVNDGLTRRQFLAASGAAAAGIGLAGGLGGCNSSSSTASRAPSAGPRGTGEVVVVTWGDPQKAKLLGDAFRQETGITLRLVPGDNSADFYNKIKAGGPGVYDVVISNVGYVPLYERDNLIEVLDLTQFSSSSELYQEFRTDKRFGYLKAPDQSLVFPNQWGSYGMTYRTAGASKPQGTPSWEALWRAPKGKVMLSAYYVNNLALAGRMIGLPWDKVFAMTGPDLDKSKQRLIDLKPFRSPSSGDAQVNEFVTKAVDVGLVYSLGFASKVNRKAGSAVAESAVPAEGVFGALDGQMLLKGARNRSNALKWIDFCGSKKAQLIFWERDRGPSSNRFATEEIISRGGLDAADIKAQQGDRPDIAAAMAQQRDPDHAEAWTKAWDQVLAG